MGKSHQERAIEVEFECLGERLYDWFSDFYIHQQIQSSQDWEAENKCTERSMEEELEIEQNDTHSIKAEEPQPKRENTHTINSLQKEEHLNHKIIDISSQFSDRESNYKEVRNEVIQRGPSTVDLNKEIFSGIVRHCRREKLISEELAHCFFTNYTTKLETLYIEHYKTNQLHRFDFAKSKINIIDHRRLVQMLLDHDPQKYTHLKPEGPYDFLKEGREFLKEIYMLPPEEYQRIIDQQVNKYYQTWWGGPENLNPIPPPEPAVEVMDVEDAAKMREEQERQEKAQREEKEQELLARISQQMATKTDLENIAKKISSKLYGRPAEEVEVKREEEYFHEEESESKQKKHKADKKDKKDKSRKKSKKNKGKAEEDVKKEWIEDVKAKKQAEDGEDLTEHPNTPHPITAN